MKPVHRILAALALSLAASQAHAEYRTVLVQVRQNKDKNTTVAIHSDEKKEQKAAVSVDEAVRIIGEMQGWGSSVGVYVVSDRSVPRADSKKLLAAVNDNHWLDLEYFGREVPKVIGDHFLKESNKAALPRAITPDRYAAYWLSKAGGDSEYRMLLVTRLPLSEVARWLELANLRPVGAPPPPPVRILDGAGLTISTYKTDSIWNVDLQPLKSLTRFTGLDEKDRSVDVDGVRHRYEECALPEVVRLLNDPSGTIPIHRIHAPLAGMEQTARALKLLLEEQLRNDKSADAPEAPSLQEARRLDGAWVVIDDGGENPVRPTGHARGSRWIIEQGSITFGHELKLAEMDRIGRYFRVDPTKDPKTIEIFIFAKRAGSGPPAGVQHGIYDLKGDRLKLYIDGLGKDKMPLVFPAEGGTAQYRVLTLERERPK
jgi:uncharacterized protein (TIGR03067 family)